MLPFILRRNDNISLKHSDICMYNELKPAVGFWRICALGRSGSCECVPVSYHFLRVDHGVPPLLYSCR